MGQDGTFLCLVGERSHHSFDRSKTIGWLHGQEPFLPRQSRTWAYLQNRTYLGYFYISPQDGIFQKFFSSTDDSKSQNQQAFLFQHTRLKYSGITFFEALCKITQFVHAFMLHMRYCSNIAPGSFGSTASGHCVRPVWSKDS